jgi:hypothetical protein
MVGSTTGVPQNRGLQLGEEQAPLFSPPDSRRPEMAYASYSLHYVTQGAGFSKFHFTKSVVSASFTEVIRHIYFW